MSVVIITAIAAKSKPPLPFHHNYAPFREMAILPKRTKEGYRVYLARISSPDVSAFDWAVAMRVYVMNVHMTLAEEGPENGYVFVFDMATLTLGHLTKLSIGYLKKFMAYVQVSFARTFEKCR